MDMEELIHSYLVGFQRRITIIAYVVHFFSAERTIPKKLPQNSNVSVRKWQRLAIPAWCLVLVIPDRYTSSYKERI